MSTVEFDDELDNLALTRYLYIKTEVKHSMLLAILDHKRDEALFWAYELYYSGFYQELIELILLIYSKIYSYTNQLLITFIETNIKLMDEHPENDYCIGSIISTLTYRNYNLVPFIEEFFKVKCEQPQNVISINRKLNINLRECDIIKYKTNYSKSATVLSLENKYSIRKCTNVLFYMCTSINYDKLHKIYNDDWLYYACQSPIWKNRIDSFNGVENVDARTIEFIDSNDEESFFNKWGYEPDEQPKIVCEYHIGTGKEPQYNIMDFCKIYNIKIATKKFTRKIVH